MCYYVGGLTELLTVFMLCLAGVISLYVLFTGTVYQRRIYSESIRDTRQSGFRGG